MKKVVSFLLCSVLLFTACLVAFAQDNSVTIYINEYELAERMAMQTPATLASEGFDSAEIATLKNYKNIYRNHIASLNELSDEALQKNGYSKSQIELIRSFTGSEQEMRRLGATMTLTATTSNFRYNGNYTVGTLKYNWAWQSVPVFKMTDMLAVSWNNWTVTANSSAIKYYKVTTGEYYTQKSATFTQDSNGVLGAAHKFAVSLSDNYYYAKSGSGSFTVQSDTHSKKDFYYYISYGHSQVQPTISFSVSAGGGEASIGFTSGTSIPASAKGSAVIK